MADVSHRDNDGDLAALNGILTGLGSPEGIIVAVVGSLYRRRDGGVGTALYVKEANSHTSTGWVAYNPTDYSATIAALQAIDTAQVGTNAAVNASVAALQAAAAGLAAVATSGSAADLSTGILPATRLPALTGGDVTSSAGSAVATIAAGAVTNVKLTAVAANTVKGRITAGTGALEDLTVAQTKTLLGITVSDITGAVTSTTVLTAGAGLVGGGDLSANRTLDVVANADGSLVVNANDMQVGVLATDAQHGVRGGGTQHANAVAAGAAGFMTGSDKTKLDGVATGATNNTLAVTASAPAAVTKATAVVGVATDAARADHKHDVTTAAASSVGSANAEGSASSLARSDHTHDLTTGSVALADMADLATARIVGRVTAATGAPEALTGAQATTLLDAFTSALKGLAPASGGGTLNFLRADGAWAASGVPVVGTATVDFGAFPGSSDTLVVVTGQTNIVAGSVVNAWIRPAATADHTADEHIVETIRVVAADIVAATGFTIYANNTSQLNEPLGYSSAGRPGQSPSPAIAPHVGGTGTRLYGLYTVAWSWQ